MLSTVFKLAATTFESVLFSCRSLVPCADLSSICFRTSLTSLNLPTAHCWYVGGRILARFHQACRSLGDERAADVLTQEIDVFRFVYFSSCSKTLDDWLTLKLLRKHQLGTASIRQEDPGRSSTEGPVRRCRAIRQSFDSGCEIRMQVPAECKPPFSFLPPSP